jgi:hypothetical protein
MSSLSIVEALDERKDRAAGLIMGPERPSIQEFTLQRGKKELLSRFTLASTVGSITGILAVGDWFGTG